jgi:hypothetical protein
VTDIPRFKGKFENLENSYQFKNHIKNNIFVTTHLNRVHKVIYMRPGRSASTLITRKMGGMEEISKPYFRKTGTNDWLENVTDYQILHEYFSFAFFRKSFPSRN